LLLFKYLCPDGALKVFEHDAELALRFELPRDYNDPYELFLQAEPPFESEDVRAFYDFFLGEVAQAPVSCFSKRPDSVVMWAHYGRGGAGICIGFDEDRLAEQFPIAFVDDVEYLDRPATVESSIVNRAFLTGKNRHALRLLDIGHRAAYFIKRSDWRYESERRLVVPPEAVEDQNGVLIARIEPQALRYIILGARVRPDVRTLCETRADDYRVPLLELKIGKRTYEPLFIDAGTSSAIWSGARFEPLESVCETCSEPTDISMGGQCEWCSISDEDRQSASGRSLLKILLDRGIVEGVPLAFDGLSPKGWMVNKPRSE
jgi:hypothetical protein